MTNFHPKCCYDEIELAVTNRGELLPCCYLDTADGMNDPEVQKLLKSSKISKNNTIDKILDSQEWQHFEKILTGPGPYPDICVFNCSLNKGEMKRKLTIYEKGHETKDIEQ